MNYNDLYRKYLELLNENKRLRKEIDLLKGNKVLEKLDTNYRKLNTINDYSTPQEKIALFKKLFVGRTDVYAKRWSSKKGTTGYTPVCLNEWIKGLCGKPQAKCAPCENRKYDEFSEKVIELHLRGATVVGIYPLLKDETCRLLAFDFDKEGWQEDIKIIRSISKELEIPLAVERSRSGNGAHAWIFFSSNVSASLARKLGTAILTYGMSKRYQIKFKSYDRLFPNQDTIPRGGFGNLIALPLQKTARMNGNSMFIDEDFKAFKDQWAYLSSLNTMNIDVIEDVISKLCQGNEYGLLKSNEENDKPWVKKREIRELKQSDFPNTCEIVLANMIYIKKEGFSNNALNSIKRLAAFKNPEFFKAQAMRLPTYNKPRIIDLSENTKEYLCLPRGCRGDLQNLLQIFKTKPLIDDKRENSNHINVQFNGSLRDRQQEAANELLKYETGVLAATTAFGKTVVGAYLISQIKMNTLIIVHTRQLLEQWKERLGHFLLIDETLPEEEKKKGRKRVRSLIGQIGAGKNRPNGIIDVALMQSLVKAKEVKDVVQNYGMVIVDECHHVPAFSFEQIMRNVHAKFVYGLTATPIRKDGHHPIIFMQCGSIRYKVGAKEASKKRSFDHFMTPRFTSFKRLLSAEEDEKYNITSIYNDIAKSDLRNNLIINDVIDSFKQGRNCIILTGRTKHVDLLYQFINERIDNVIKLTGKLTAKQRRLALESLANIPEGENFVIVATGSFVGEGFDEPRLDTLFLALPVAWKGTITQYVGRLHRDSKSKSEVIVYDYVDIHIPVLERMYHKRLKTYAAIGYKTKSERTRDIVDSIYDQETFLPVFEQDLIGADSEIIIVSPFISKRRLLSILKNILVLAKPSVNIIVVTRPKEDIKTKDQRLYQANINSLIDYGIKLVFKSKLHQKFAIIDKTIVWYGSINILSYGKSPESVMRLNSFSIANELIGTIR